MKPKKSTEVKKAERDLEKMTRKVLGAISGGAFLYWFIAIIRKIIASTELRALLEETFEAKSAEEIYAIMKEMASDQLTWETAVVLNDIIGLARAVENKLGH